MCKDKTNLMQFIIVNSPQYPWRNGCNEEYIEDSVENCFSPLPWIGNNNGSYNLSARILLCRHSSSVS